MSTTPDPCAPSDATIVGLALSATAVLFATVSLTAALSVDGTLKRIQRGCESTGLVRWGDTTIRCTIEPQAKVRGSQTVNE